MRLSTKSVNESLCAACGAGDIRNVDRFVSAGADINYSKGQPLISAIRFNKLDVVKHLIEELEAQPFSTALTWAIRMNNSNIVAYLISQEIDVNGDDGIPLLEAIQNRNKYILQLLIEKNAQLSEADKEFLGEEGVKFYSEVKVAVSIQEQSKLQLQNQQLVDKEMITEALCRAAANNNIVELRRLLNSGVNPNIREKRYQITALHAAVSSRHPEAVRLLVDHNADVNIPNARGQTPIDINREDLANNPKSERVLVIRRLLSQKQETLRQAGQQISEEKQESIVDKEVRVEELCRAAANNNIVELRRLLNSDVNPNIRERRYQITALHAAVFSRHPEAVRLLVDHNADVNILNARGQTPIDINREDLANNPKSERVLAIRRLLFQKQEMLRQGGQQISEEKQESIVDKEVRVEELCRAAANNNIAELQRLLIIGVNPNIREKRYQITALHAAVFSRHPEAVRLLVDHNADVSIGDPLGQTPISVNLKDWRNNPRNEEVLEIYKILHGQSEHLCR